MGKERCQCCVVMLGGMKGGMDGGVEGGVDGVIEGGFEKKCGISRSQRGTAKILPERCGAWWSKEMK